MVAEAAFDINEIQGKEGGQARVDGSQYKNKERVTSIGSAKCTSHKVIFGNCQRNSHSQVGHSFALGGG